LTLPGGGAIGSGLNAVPATVGPPAGAATLPAAIVPTGTVTGGDATPAAEQPPVVQPDAAGGDGPSAAAAKGDEAPAIGTRLEGFLAALAAAAYGLWHWRRHSVKDGAGIDGRASGRKPDESEFELDSKCKNSSGLRPQVYPRILKPTASAPSSMVCKAIQPRQRTTQPARWSCLRFW